MAAETTPPGDHHRRAVVDEDDDDYDDYDDDEEEEEVKEGYPPAWYTPLPSIGPLVSEAHATYRSGRTRPLAFRDAQLHGVERLVRDNAGALCRAVRRDLGQSRNYVEIFELDLVSSRCRVARASLGGWASTSRVPTPWPHNLAAPVRSEVAVEPRGVATLITPWNMPVLLALSPLVDALAAGNVCVLKMSELSRHTTRLLTDLLSSGEYVDAGVVRVVNGGAEVGSELLRHRVDAISYTGGGGVGRIVAAAAAIHLTPTLLELGGKNPCFVTGNAHVRSAARRIAWGKITGNAGQMCMCPDYVLVEEIVREEFVDELCRAMDECYPVSSYADDGAVGGGGIGRGRRRGDVGRMISVRHAERVVGLVDSTCRVIYGGRHHDVGRRFVAPTIVEATFDSTVMREEVFGPVLAIVPVPSVDDALRLVNERFTSRAEHPLVLYIFSGSREEQQKIAGAVPSGMCSINEVLKIAANWNLPFGGVGASGMGAANGRHGFDFFSHRRGTLVSGNRSTSRWDPSVWVITPPFDDRKRFAFQCVAKVPSVLERLKPIITRVVVPIALALMAMKAMKS